MQKVRSENQKVRNNTVCLFSSWFSIAIKGRIARNNGHVRGVEVLGIFFYSFILSRKTILL